jgi:hypothetical protein
MYLFLKSPKRKVWVFFLFVYLLMLWPHPWKDTPPATHAPTRNDTVNTLRTPVLIVRSTYVPATLFGSYFLTPFLWEDPMGE